MSTDEGDIVLDPFVGTGTTAISAKRLGRSYIGFDLDEKYVTITNDKLMLVEPLSKLGNYWVSFYLNEIVTIRDKDWEGLKEYFVIPDNPADIDKMPIYPKKNFMIHTPLCAKKDYATDLFSDLDSKLIITRHDQEDKKNT
jgi:site-specific DNA-methyltransferase (adenine-specific)